MHCLLVKLIWYLRMVGLQLQGPVQGPVWPWRWPHLSG